MNAVRGAISGVAQQMLSLMSHLRYFTFGSLLYVALVRFVLNGPPSRVISFS